MNATEATAHFHENPTPELIQFVIDHALEHSRYIFYKRVVGSLYKGYCTHCEEDSYLEQPLKHNKVTTCPNCKSKCIAFQAGRGRGQLVDRVYVEFADKSLVDPAAITVSGYWVVRDYREDYLQPKTTYNRCAMYIFKQGASYMFSRGRWYSAYTKNVNPHSLHNTMMFGREQAFFSRASLKKAIKGTSLQYSMALKYENHHLIEYLALYCKYPFVEILTKLNLIGVIEARLNKQSTKGLINWRGKTLDSIIGLPKRDWKHFKNATEPSKQISCTTLKYFKDIRASHPDIPPADLLDICLELQYNTYLLLEVLAETKQPLKKIHAYLIKQFEKYQEKYAGIASVYITYRDYIRHCKEMNMDVTDPSNLFPRDVHEMHQRQIERKKAIANAKYNARIKRRARELAHNTFEYNGLFIRPFASAMELTVEGNRLKHCVAGNYAQQYADGKTELYMVRSIDTPEQPFFTVEIKNRRVVQCRGFENCVPTEDVEAFMKAFNDAVLHPKKSWARKVI
ncbi:PcfJ domain-containing protein [Lysinibacillus sp. KU-BSD001]|uniref:PcfJ domain-containing protein n=1 Tax=Lysinibacillus sp. KU-BSD001 TaxID=3141328 RepID=UPI0036EB8819